MRNPTSTNLGKLAKKDVKRIKTEERRKWLENRMRQLVALGLSGPKAAERAYDEWETLLNIGERARKKKNPTWKRGKFIGELSPRWRQGRFTTKPIKSKASPKEIYLQNKKKIDALVRQRHPYVTWKEIGEMFGVSGASLYSAWYFIKWPERVRRRYKRK